MPSERGSRLAAAVDIGSTSVHLLVGVVGVHAVQPVLDESAFLGLGAVVRDTGTVGAAASAALAAALSGYDAHARSLGARSITGVATEPLRRALDAEAVVQRAAAVAGVPIHVLTHEEEALLTVIGATGGRRVTRGLVVVDVGGGSSEVAVVSPSGSARVGGLRIGAGQLTAAFAAGDPPTRDEIEAMWRAATLALAAAPDGDDGDVVAVGGTAEKLLLVAPDDELGAALTRSRLDRAVEAILAQPADELAAAFGLRQARARILAGGAAILRAAMDRYEVDRLTVSATGIREGTILASVHGGAGWRDRLGALARGWGDRPTSNDA